VKTFVIFFLCLSCVVYLVYKVTGQRKQAATVATGWIIFESVSALFDVILWPVVQNSWGIYSLPFLFVAALVIDLTMLYFYQTSDEDWMGVDALEELKAKSMRWEKMMFEHPNVLVRIIAFFPVRLYSAAMFLLRKNDVTAFVLLSGYNPFLCTAFLMHGKRGKLGKTGWKIFLSSMFISFAVWVGVVQAGLELLKLITRILLNT